MYCIRRRQNIIGPGPVKEGCNPDSKFQGANIGPIWGRQDPGGPHVGPMNFATWEYISTDLQTTKCKYVLFD